MSADKAAHRQIYIVTWCLFFGIHLALLPSLFWAVDKLPATPGPAFANLFSDLAGWFIEYFVSYVWGASAVLFVVLLSWWWFWLLPKEEPKPKWKAFEILAVICCVHSMEFYLLLKLWHQMQ